MYSGIKSYEVGKGTPAQTPKIRETKPFTSSERIDESWSPLFDGKHIGRYVNYWKQNNWIKYGRWLAAPRDPNQFVGDKILIRKIVGDTLLCMKAEGTNYCNTLLFVLKFKQDIKSNLSFVLGILNSNFIGWYFRKKLMISVADEFPQIMIRDILTFPIPMSGNQSPLVNLVEQMLITQQRMASTQRETEREQHQNKREYLDAEIDRLVYELYGLTADEIKIVEGN
jgi:adenine-specific DNA-methyltransferase